MNDRPIRIDGSPRANGILDTIMVCKAHGIKVPSEFEDVKVLETLEAAVVHEWFVHRLSSFVSRLSFIVFLLSSSSLHVKYFKR
jgi:hypothetical protein